MMQPEFGHDHVHGDADRVAASTALTLLAAGWLAAFPFIPIWLRVAGVVVLVAGAALAKRMRLTLAFSTSLMYALALGGTTIPLLRRLWPAPLLIALIGTSEPRSFHVSWGAPTHFVCSAADHSRGRWWPRRSRRPFQGPRRDR